MKPQIEGFAFQKVEDKTFASKGWTLRGMCTTVETGQVITKFITAERTSDSRWGSVSVPASPVIVPASPDKCVSVPVSPEKSVSVPTSPVKLMLSHQVLLHYHPVQVVLIHLRVFCNPHVSVTSVDHSSLPLSCPICDESCSSCSLVWSTQFTSQEMFFCL